MQTPNTPTYDFKKPIEVTSVKLAKKLLEMIVENQDWMLYDDTTMTEESRHEYAIKQIDFNIDVMKELAKTDIPADFASYPFEKLLALIQPMIKMTIGRVKEYQDEVMARTLGVRSPLNNKFRQDVATLQQVLLKLDEVRQDTGGDKYDYFDKPVEAVKPEEEVIESPYNEKN